MNIAVSKNGPIRSYRLADIETVLKKERPTFFLTEMIIKGCPRTLHFDTEYIHEDSIDPLMIYLHREFGLLLALSIKEYIRGLKSKVQRRTYSTSHRIEIAYKSKYRCNMCNMLLPPGFAVDHIIELCDGGEDVYDNCQALCPNCHAEKTRCNILRRDKTFKDVYGKKFEEMQKNAFDKFKFNKSKYF
tara:strand:+ start:1480 stop:2043 length:564 start_codon:yes stop_codon:yes gene_type:complete